MMAVAFEDDRASYRQARSHFAAAAANRLKPKADEGCETWKGLTEPPSKSRELQRHGGGAGLRRAWAGARSARA